MYDEHLRAANINTSARAFAGGSGSSQAGFPGQFNADSSQNRSVSVVENGKKISIIENKNGIIVSVNGKRVRAKNAAELKRKFPDAFRLYEKHLEEANGFNAQPDATALLRKELRRFRDENANNPQLRNLIERMMQNVAP